MLEVVELDERTSAPEIRGDEHVPLMIRWGLTPSVIWQSIWPNGQICCELKVSTAGARVNGVTLLNPPPITFEEPVESADWEETGIPIVSLDPFDPNPDLVPQRQVAESHCSPTAVHNGGWLEIRFDQTPPLKWATSGAVGFGISEEARLVAIRISATSIPPSLIQ